MRRIDTGRTGLCRDAPARERTVEGDEFETRATVEAAQRECTVEARGNRVDHTSAIAWFDEPGVRLRAARMQQRELVAARIWIHAFEPDQTAAAALIDAVRHDLSAAAATDESPDPRNRAVSGERVLVRELDLARPRQTVVSLHGDLTGLVNREAAFGQLRRKARIRAEHARPVDSAGVRAGQSRDYCDKKFSLHDSSLIFGHRRNCRRVAHDRHVRSQPLR
jgi:hypothetical protein